MERRAHWGNIPLYKDFPIGKLIWSDSLGVDMLASHILCTKEDLYALEPKPLLSIATEKRKTYNCSCKLNTKLILPLRVHFPVWLFRSESQNICQPTEIHDDEETTWRKVTWVHWVDDGSLLRQLRRHYISSWILQECNQMCSQESSKTWVFLQHGQ